MQLFHAALVSFAERRAIYMKDKMEYLRAYTLIKDADAYVYQPCEIKKIPAGIIPQYWHDALSREDADKRIQGILETWKKYVMDELYLTIGYLEENLSNIELLRINDTYYLLYSVKKASGKIRYYAGGNPQDSVVESNLQNVWNKIPQSIRCFYENVHNGFYDYACKAMGLVRTSDITYLGDDEWEWGIIEDLEEDLQIDMESTYGFFSNMMGTYVAVDIMNCDIDSATLWSAKGQPKYHLNFWDVVDEWIKIGMED